jgi:hypothetical protein
MEACRPDGAGQIVPLEVYDKTGNVLRETFKVINPIKVSPDADTVIVYRIQCRR